MIDRNTTSRRSQTARAAQAARAARAARRTVRGLVITGMRQAGFVAALLLGLHTSVNAQHTQTNAAFLGVVSAPAEPGLQLLLVLDRSPAQDAGLRAGDVLTRAARASLAKPEDLDAALSQVQPGSLVELEWLRDGEAHSGSAAVINWRQYRGAFLRGRARGATGFEAPEWYAYAWHQKEQAMSHSPTRRNTAGKVVVIHAFQAW